MLVNEPRPAVPAAGEFNRNHHFGNAKGVIEVHPADVAVLSAPVFGSFADFPEDFSRPVSQAVHDVARACFPEIFDLLSRALQEAVVIQQLQPPQDLLRRAGNKGADVRGAQEAMPVDEPDDIAVALG